jgi:drug/metabolite transporter (DMT)-like permease
MVTLAAASWGTWSLFLRPTGLSAAITTPILMTVMGLVALPFALRAPRAKWDRSTIALLFGNAAFDSLNVLTFFASINYTTVAIAVITHYVAPIMIAVAAPYIEKQAISARTWPAAIVALAGLVIVLEPWKAPTEGAAIGRAATRAADRCAARDVLSRADRGGRVLACAARHRHRFDLGVGLRAGRRGCRHDRCRVRRDVRGRAHPHR